MICHYTHEKATGIEREKKNTAPNISNPNLTLHLNDISAGCKCHITSEEALSCGSRLGVQPINYNMEILTNTNILSYSKIKLLIQ